MKTNLGSADRIIRVVLGIALIALFFAVEGPVRYAGLFGFVLLATAAMRFCPIYAMFRLSSYREPAIKTEKLRVG